MSILGRTEFIYTVLRLKYAVNNLLLLFFFSKLFIYRRRLYRDVTAKRK